MRALSEWIDASELRIVPANEASWEDIRDVLGRDGRTCLCQRYKIDVNERFYGPVEVHEEMLRDQTNCGIPDAPLTSGIVAYFGGESVGWCAVEPRVEYTNLGKFRVPWRGRTEDRADGSVWAVTCFTVRTGFRRRGIMHALTAAALEHARARGARAVEGYPMVTEPGKEITWGELHVGSIEAFEAAGFELVTRPTLRRAVMRVAFSLPDHSPGYTTPD